MFFAIKTIRESRRIELDLYEKYLRLRSLVLLFPQSRIINNGNGRQMPNVDTI
jgi:hypothetical protein